MSQRKKVVVPTTDQRKAPVPKTKPANVRSASARELTFTRQNYLLMVAGVVVMIIGMFLMSGGSMPDPNTWDESMIYSGRRITLAPMVILAGLIIEIVAIFKTFPATPSEV